MFTTYPSSGVWVSRIWRVW